MTWNVTICSGFSHPACVREDSSCRQGMIAFGTQSSPDDEDYPMWFLVIYAIISILGMLGNLLVIILITVIPRLRTPPNIFVLNLCFADFLLGFNAVFAFVEEVDAEWVLNGGGCRVFGFISFMPPIAVVLSMVVVAKIRYLAITTVSASPDKLTRTRVTILLALIWILSALISLPILLGWVSVRAGLFCACCFYFRENVIYGITVTTVGYVLPNILILYYYIRIFLYVRKSRMRVQQHQGSTRTAHGSAKKADIQLAVQFIVLFCIFNVCYTPTMIVFWVEDENHSLSVSANAVIMLIFALNLILNPLAYFAFNKGARREIAKCCRGKKSNLSADTRSRDGMRESPAHGHMAEAIAASQPETSHDRFDENSSLQVPSKKQDRFTEGQTKTHTVTIENNSRLEVRTSEPNGYLLIACESSLSNGAMPTVENSVNKNRKLSVDKGLARPPANATVFLDPQAYFLAVPSRTGTGTSRSSPAQTQKQAHRGDTLRLERLSVVSFVESFDESSGEAANGQSGDSDNSLLTSTTQLPDGHTPDTKNKPLTITDGPIVTAIHWPLRDSDILTTEDNPSDSGFKE